MFKRTVLSLTLAMAATGVAMAAANPTGPSSQPIVVNNAAGDTETRLACNTGAAERNPQCNLRIYQIMVESFVDGDASRDFNTGYGPSHHKGDLKGVLASLDYIKASGFNAIWLTPIFESVPLAKQDHWADRLDATGYYASHFFAIDPRFGSMADAKELVEAAHARGLYVFFDGVFGHFKSNAEQYPSPSGHTVSTTGQTLAGTGREASYPHDLAFFKEVATYWIKELKIDGWRLDQAYQVPVAYWPELKKAVAEASASVHYQNAQGEKQHPLGYMVAEIWNGADYITTHGYGSNSKPALASAFDFPVRTALVQSTGGDKDGNHSRPATALANAMRISLQYPDHAMPNLMLSTHDVPRFGDLLERVNLAQYGSAEYWARFRAAFGFMAAYSGPLTVLYNDEIGAQLPNFAGGVNSSSCALQGLCDDHVGRLSARILGVPGMVGAKPATFTKDESNLRDYVARLMELRDSHLSLSQGSRTPIYADDDLYIDRKSAGSDHTLFLLNIGDEPRSISLSKQAIGSTGLLTNLLSGKAIAAEGENYLIKLAPFESLFLGIEKPTAVLASQKKIAVDQGRMARCDLPVVEGDDPLGKRMWIRGSYRGGNNFLATPAAREFKYKGGNLYQVVVEEPATAFTFKFASSDWSKEFAVVGSAPVTVGTIQPMAKASGHGTESSIVIEKPGRYVYSFETSSHGIPQRLYVGPCQ